MRWIAAAALGMVFGAATIAVEAAADCRDRPMLHDGWTAVAPEQQALDPAVICAIGPHLEGLKDANPHGVVIVRHGNLVYEHYFTGEDQRWPQQHWGEPLVTTRHDVGTKHDLQSITKSVVALLTGIALDRSLLKSLDAPALSLFPEYADLRTPEKDRIRVRDLLTMSAGLHWPYQPYLSMARKVDAAADPYRLVLEQPVSTAPGKTWRYNNGSAEVVGGIVAKATGIPLDQFARQALFDPLGIEDWEWGRMANGDAGASWGLRLRPRDLAKIGQLVLDRGVWRGRRIVSTAWIDAMIAPQIARQTGSYGYLWWIGKRTSDGREVDVVSAYGWGGQGLFLVPSLDLVVVVTAGVYSFDGQGPQGLTGYAAMEMVLRAATRH